MSVVKGTFNDMIGKGHISASVEAKLLLGTPGEIGAKGGAYSDSTDQTVSSTSTDAPPERSVCPENTCIFPAVSMYSSVKRSHSLLDFQDTGPNSSHRSCA